MRFILVFCLLLSGKFPGIEFGFGDPIADPCLTAEDIGDPKRSIDYVPTDFDTALCDTDLETDKWYRFNAFTGGKMPEQCVGINHCGTFGTIWLNGKHPTEANQEPITVPVCAEYISGECCGWTEDIKVKRCVDDANAEYFVYQLVPPPSCDIAYCAGSGLPCGKGLGYNSVTKTCTQLPKMTSNPILGAPYISYWKIIAVEGNPEFNASRFSIDCTIGYPKQEVDDGIRFDVVFEMDGTKVYEVQANSTDLVVTMEESRLVGHMGKTLTCKVRVYLETNDPAVQKSRFYVSNDHWFGLRPTYMNGTGFTSLALRQEQEFSFQMVPTYPVTFAHCLQDPKKCFKSHTFRFFNTIKNAKVDKKCGFALSSVKEVSTMIKIAGVTTVGPSRNVGQISFLKDNTTSIHKGYTIRPITITINEDTDQPLCQSTGDPHITTFGGSYYDNYMIGDFNYLSTKDRTFQIQVRQIRCGSVSCNCGVIVREGNNILGISSCDNLPTPRLIKYLLDLETPSGTIDQINSEYVINLLSGVKIRAVPFWGSFMHIYIYGRKMENYEGFCAKHTTGATNFESLRVGLADSFFQFSSSNPPKCLNETVSVPNCDCKGKDWGDDGNQEFISISCDAERINKSVNMFVTKYVCGPNGKRRKRDVSQSDEDVIDLDDILASVKPIDANYTPPADPKWPTQVKGITQEQATRACHDGLQRSPAYETCKVRVDTAPLVHNCVTDIQLMEELSLAENLATELEQLCQYKIESSILVTDEEPSAETKQQMEKLQEIQSVICPSQCSRRGHCVNGTCQCNEGFIGEDCSMVVGQKPAIHGLISKNCNSREATCTKIYIQATNITNSANGTCRITASNKAVVYSVMTFMSAGTVSCPIPQTDAASFPNMIKVSVSISNDNESFSDEKPFFAYDGKCMECQTDENCKQKSGTCLISNRCYRSGETNPQDSRKVCNHLTSQTSWTGPDGNVDSMAARLSVTWIATIFLSISIVSFFQ